MDGKSLFEDPKQHNFIGALSPPPNRIVSAEPGSTIDPWSAGADPWIRTSIASSSSGFAKKYRLAVSPTDSQSFVVCDRQSELCVLFAVAVSPDIECNGDKDVVRVADE